MTKIKICGLKREEDIEIVNKLKPDFIGFVFATSSRQINDKKALKLRNKLFKDIISVGVFVNEDIDRIKFLCDEQIIQMIQLHGDENEDYIKKLRDEVLNVPIIKAVRVKSREQIIEAANMDCEYLLLDTYVKDVYGGSGHTFDKSLIPKIEKPFFLAGGLNADNVLENTRKVKPFAVDVSSAVETDGIKDERKIKEFIERIRENEQ